MMTASEKSAYRGSLLALLAGVSLVLAAIGLYGVISFMVVPRKS